MYTTTHGITVIEATDNMADLATLLQSMSTTTEAAIAAQEALVSSAWVEYTPEWHASIVDPTIGNGYLSGRYRQVGLTVDVVASVTFGSTTTGGEGYYSISLPVAPRTGRPEQRLHVDVRAPHIGDPAPRWIGDVRVYSQSPDMTIYFDGGGEGDGRVSRFTAVAPLPGGMQESDIFTIWGTYEADAA